MVGAFPIDPLALLALLKIIMLSQRGRRYPFARQFSMGGYQLSVTVHAALERAEGTEKIKAPQHFTELEGEDEFANAVAVSDEAAFR
jgi:hypothetical protein